MATVPQVSENPTVQQHYVVQAALVESLAEAVAGVDAPNLRAAVASLTREFQAASIALSADYYTELRDLAEVPGSFSVPVLDPWTEADLSAYFDTVLREITDDVERAKQAAATSQRLTLDSGIDEVFAAIEKDPAKPRWARVTRPGACSFCLMLAMRGAVYRSEESANFRAHTRYENSGGVCRCSVEPSFTNYEPPAHIREMQQLYSEATTGLPRGADRANAFRRALYASRKTSR